MLPKLHLICGAKDGPEYSKYVRISNKYVEACNKFIAIRFETKDLFDGVDTDREFDYLIDFAAYKKFTFANIDRVVIDDLLGTELIGYNRDNTYIAAPLIETKSAGFVWPNIQNVWPIEFVEIPFIGVTAIQMQLLCTVFKGPLKLAFSGVDKAILVNELGVEYEVRPLGVAILMPALIHDAN